MSSEGSSKKQKQKQTDSHCTQQRQGIRTCFFSLPNPLLIICTFLFLLFPSRLRITDRIECQTLSGSPPHTITLTYSSRPPHFALVQTWSFSRSLPSNNTTNSPGLILASLALHRQIELGAGQGKKTGASREAAVMAKGCLSGGLLTLHIPPVVQPVGG